jgi:hypothetical protein
VSRGKGSADLSGKLLRRNEGIRHDCTFLFTIKRRHHGTLPVSTAMTMRIAPAGAVPMIGLGWYHYAYSLASDGYCAGKNKSAMTGEINLAEKVPPVRCIKEKILRKACWYFQDIIPVQKKQKGY